MSRFAPFLGIIAALALGASIALLSEPRAPEGAAPAPSTLSVFPDFSPLELSLPDLIPQAEPKAPDASPPPLAPVSEKAPSPAPARSAVPVAVPAASAVEINAALDAAASALRAALVNIICYVPRGSGLHSISGSGVFVDPKGVILTNAHIAQYFLLADRGVSCSIRSGSPAIDRYRASLMFISPAWVSANAGVLIEALPLGTGEHDFAFLAVTASSASDPLPPLFPSLPLAERPPSSGMPVVIASYGAQFLESSQVQSSLFPTIVFGSVKDVFTFAVHTVDVLALGGSAAAQEGSSGGGVAGASGELLGAITTSTVEGTTDTRSLSAITASYIRSAYASETGQALDLLLAKPPASAAADFAPQIPALEALLTAHLP